ncbi:MAG: iron ABC transporter permease [Clostridia bacterium]|nr:iron ABC transporter permease [Clostridia bacterium]
MKRTNKAVPGSPENRGAKIPPAARWILLILLPLVTAAACLCIGRIPLSPADVLRSIGAKLTGGEGGTMLVESTLWRIRLPRILLGLLTGAGLSAAGCAFQSLFSNPLATPDTLGVASGASFGAALGLLLGMKLVGVQLMALAMGGAAVLLTALCGGGGRRQGLSGVVLAGIMMGSLFNALISFVKFTADTETELPSITYWLMGTLGAAGYRELALGAPPVLFGIAVLLLLRWRMNLLPLGEDEIRASGVNVRLLRGTVILCATLVTASSVSMCGQVGWVGLLVPHICRMRFGGDHRKLLPASVFLGAAFLVVVDTAARTISPSDLPISILTAMIGAPFFIFLMRRTEGWRL